MLPSFHPAVGAWFARQLGSPTECQRRAWPAIRAGEHTLVAAPTGSGKTLAAFLCAINDLVCEGLQSGLRDETYVVYVSPLRALSNDIERNLRTPIAGIRDELLMSGLSDVDIRVCVRTGDTPAYARALMRRRPPHIIVTTPESLYILLTSASGRRMLATARTVIIDEIHAVAGNKRGAHLSLSLARLSALCAREPTRIGLSATQRPIEETAHFLTGAGQDATPSACTIIDLGHQRDRDLAIELPESPLEAVMSTEVWTEIYDRLAALVSEHRATLVFVNTRRLSERVAHHLSERLGAGKVAAHHGSLSREHRLQAEQRLKSGELPVMVATASLELGIDIGDIDLVCQLGSPRSISTFLQRAGRAGHALGALPKARLFPLSRDEFVECMALLDAVHRGELDALSIPAGGADVLAQQIVAAVAMEEWDEEALFALMRRAWPYRNLARPAFTAVVRMLAEGFASRRGRAGALLHRDLVQGRLRPRRGARLIAVTCGGAIPDNADYEVREEPTGTFIGTVNEDFAIESIAGDIFQLGNTSWRILRVEAGTVRVEDARGQPPSIPFWFGEAPARSHALSHAVSRLRAEFERQWGQAEAADRPARAHLLQWLAARKGVPFAAVEQAVDYLMAAKRALGCLPTQRTLVVERFFDESGGMQLVLHAPFGGRLNRAWGLALRKCFCRRFNFELQAAATEDAVVLSLGETNSFPLEEVYRFLHPDSVREVLTQALLEAPMFKVRWRWNAAVALAVPRFSSGRKVPPRLQRMRAEDLLAVVFPDGRACLENIAGGRREVPDHPLVRQTVHDCLHEAMDIEALEAVLRDIEAGKKRLVARDLTEPSPLAAEILGARPYAFLDDAPLEERRTRAVSARRWLNPESAADLGRLDPRAIARVREDAWPDAGDADELHDALLWLTCLTDAEVENAQATPSAHSPSAHWRGWLDVLASQRRSARLLLPDGRGLWVAAERLPLFDAVYGNVARAPAISAPEEVLSQSWSAESALIEIVRGRLQGLGPVKLASLAAALGLPPGRVEQALLALEAEGFVLRGCYTPAAPHGSEWCERRLLARIHHDTLQTLRRAVAPVGAATFIRFLLGWQHLLPAERLFGEESLRRVLEQLQGFAAPAIAWERDVLPARVANYEPAMLDQLCLSGRVTWARLPPTQAPPASLRTAPLAFFLRRHFCAWQQAVVASRADGAGQERSAAAARVVEWLGGRGPTFAEELADATGLGESALQSALAELVGRGEVVADSYEGVRQLLRGAGQGPRRETERGAGRWSLTRTAARMDGSQAQEVMARTLVQRYGVVFRRLLDRETALPPWRVLLNVYRRLEARGELRGGRFVDGFAGEQFALPEAVTAMRETARRGDAGEWVVVSAADPMNMAGILTPGPRLPALSGNRLLYRHGLPLAQLRGQEISFAEGVDDAEHWLARSVLLGQAKASMK
ncbi:MAG: DEAD/DEAH box helicase [Chromatiales bacterium]